MRKDAPPGSEAALLTVAEVAALDRCSTKTVRRAIQAGLLPVLRIGPGRCAIRITRTAHAAYRAGIFKV
ncbi:helix-turn-helix domain-containing protein [Rhodobacter sp. Har01]|uniref:helix-turn-helix domain-containing protein n=1 Tax=Rhodobacter sp. Har01 TaxID=2883999 RepID=UPI001D071A1F|nr:helix-turn-helix domain-containing protein [Rhodobacter sp. Har01]MCB6180200.1 helix-turn-helix domain-containing protein [Rhodobacter sp. Har01]